MLKRGEVRIDADLLNAWTALNLVLQNPDGNFWDDLGPVRKFEDQVRGGGYAAEEAERIIDGTNPDIVGKYNKLVEEFNADLERLKREKDAAAARDFYNRAMKLIRGGK